MRSHLALTLTVGLSGLFLLQHSAVAQDKTSQPPAGFVSLIKGDSLDGWHGMSTYDFRKLADMTEEKRAAQLAEWTADAKKHWTVKDGELINDGHGAYLTTDKDYGDIEPEE